MRSKTVLLVGGLLALALFAGACTSSKGSAQSGSSKHSRQASNTASGYNPNIDPSNFVKKIDNPLFPLESGTTYELRGKTDEGIEHETVTVTRKKKTVIGVPTTVVKDIIMKDGRLAEKTFDWYAQDKQGNVWYFGENTVAYENGKANREGTWKSGVNGASPGIIMNASPQVTDSYRQEHYKGHAEDLYWVIAKNQPIKVPYGSFHNALLTMEWTPLEPKVVSEKFYVPGIGEVAERDLAGGTENFELLSVTYGG